MSQAITLRLTHPSMPAGRVEGFSLVWAFYVTGFNPEKHCQFCFRGLRAPNFHSRNAASGVDIVLDRLDVSHVVYMCGVAKGPDAERRYRNLHLPVRFEAGASASLTTYNGYRIDVMNGVQLPIPPVEDGWRGLPAKHTRCKNFRFGLAQFGLGGGDAREHIRAEGGRVDESGERPKPASLDITDQGPVFGARLKAGPAGW